VRQPPTALRAPAAPGPEVDLLRLQRHAGNQAVGRWLSGGAAASPPGGGAPDGRDASPGRIRPLRVAHGPVVQRKASTADAARGRDVEPTGPARRLIVDDEADALERGQLRKSEFLDALKARVCAVAEESLRGTIWSAAGCPYIERWFGHYAKQPSAQIERALLKYAPEAGGATNAGQYVDIVTARVQRGMAEWRRSGEVSGLPPEFAEAGMPGVSLQGLVSAGLGAAGRAIAGAVRGVGRAVSGAVRAMFKRRSGGAQGHLDPRGVQQRLGHGRSLEPGTRARMERVFGSSFGHVRLHTGERAAQLAGELDAHAFTVGRDVAFGSGEYRPGTLIGDALLAHELAHVVQQGGASLSRSAKVDQQTETEALEADADSAAAGVVGLLWGGVTPSALPDAAAPQRRSGLALRRCGGSDKKSAKTPKRPMTADEKRRARFTSKASARREATLKKAADDLREVGKWVSDQASEQGARSESAVVGLDPKQRKRVEAVIATVQAAGAQADPSVLDPVRAKLDVVSKELKDIRTVDDQHLALIRASDAAEASLGALAKASAAVDGYELSKEIDKLIVLIDRMKPQGDLEFDRRALNDEVNGIKNKIRTIKEEAAKFPAAVETVLFVLRSFLLANTPGAKPPSAADIKKFSAAKTDQAELAFRLVFMGNEGLDFFTLYADRLMRQIRVHEKMQEAKKPATRFIPTQGDVEAFFTSLRSKPNDEVKEAYEAYAAAYFYHRGVVTVGDMRVTDVSQLYARKTSITGTRPLVCSGYAQLGAHLLTQAGGSVVTFVNGVRATPQQLANDSLSVGHSIAHVTRRGQNLFVSNDSIDATLAEGLSLLDTGDPNSRLFQARGRTQNESVDALIRVLQRNTPAAPAGRGRRP
jgi:hypothetical protein